MKIFVMITNITNTLASFSKLCLNENLLASLDGVFCVSAQLVAQRMKKFVRMRGNNFLKLLPKIDKNKYIIFRVIDQTNACSFYVAFNACSLYLSRIFLLRLYCQNLLEISIHALLQWPFEPFAQYFLKNLRVLALKAFLVFFSFICFFLTDRLVGTSL